jgi:hypothetical protein
MKQILIAIVCLFMGAGAASAQTVDTKVCDILAHPKDFGRRFRGQEISWTDGECVGENSWQWGKVRRWREIKICGACFVALEQQTWISFLPRLAGRAAKGMQRAYE